MTGVMQGAAQGCKGYWADPEISVAAVVLMYGHSPKGRHRLERRPKETDRRHSPRSRVLIPRAAEVAWGLWLP